MRFLLNKQTEDKDGQGMKVVTYLGTQGQKVRVCFPENLVTPSTLLVYKSKDIITIISDEFIPTSLNNKTQNNGKENERI